RPLLTQSEGSRIGDHELGTMVAKAVIFCVRDELKHIELPS
ncbi:18418_t:CDS:1, partial [Gigaspora rosea]